MDFWLSDPEPVKSGWNSGCWGAFKSRCKADSSLLEKSTKGGLIVLGALNLGGSVEPLANAVGIVEVAVEKGADTVLMPVSERKQLFELSDDMATRINIQFYADTPDALLKALLE